MAPVKIGDRRRRGIYMGLWTMLVLPGLAGGDLLRIMPLGDSNTGIDKSLFPSPPYDYSQPAFQNLNKYRQALFNLLTADGYQADFVGTQHTGQSGLADWDNEAHAGWRTDEVLRGPGGDGVGGLGDWLGQLAAAGELPDIVLVMLGTNDVLEGAVYRRNAADNLRAILSLLADRLPSAAIFLATIPPITFSDPKWNGYAVALNAKMPNIVAEQVAFGHNVILADVNSALGPADVSEDHIHLNATGLDKVGQVWRDAIVVAMPEPATAGTLAVGGLALFVRLRRRIACR